MQHATEGATWHRILTDHAWRFPERAALVLGSHRVTYADLARRVDECATQLARLGLGRGDRLAVLSPPRPEAMITLLAAARLGAVWLGINPRFTSREIGYVLGHAAPRIVLCAATFEGRPFGPEVAGIAATLAPAAFRVVPFDIDAEDDAGLLEALRAEPGGSVGSDGSGRSGAIGGPDDPCMLVYTSGTTGRPKGVLLRQRSLIVRSRRQCATFAVSDYPRVINFSPINHIGGMHFRGLAPLLGGATLVYQDRYRPARMAALIVEHRINLLMLMPTMFRMLLEEPSFDPELLRRLEWFVISGGAMPVPMLELLVARCPKVGTTYGLTESCGTVCCAFTPDSVETLWAGIGRPLPPGEVRVAGETGESIAPGTEGELQVRPDDCMAGYLGDEAATRAAFTRDGWLKTGDVARLRGDGTIQLVGRTSDMFKSGGYNVYPREIEAVLEEHPAVALAAVIGVEDARFQEVGHAFVVARGGDRASGEELLRWCRERLANYKVPKHLSLLDELPLLAGGKIDKRALRASVEAS